MAGLVDRDAVVRIEKLLAPADFIGAGCPAGGEVGVVAADQQEVCYTQQRAQCVLKSRGDYVRTMVVTWVRVMRIR